MVFRFLANYLLNRTDLIERMANSRIMRRAAQLTVYLFHRSKSALEDKGAMELKDKVSQQVKDFMQHQNPSGKVKQFSSNFRNELRKEWEKARGGGNGKSS